MVEDYHISLDQMMELAGRNLADLAGQLLSDRRIALSSSRIIVCAGSGHNGGGGLTAARHLHNRGADITVILSSSEEKLKPATKIRLVTLRTLNVTILQATEAKDGLLSSADLIVDALVGYQLKGEPRGIVADLMNNMIASENPHIVSLDVPSGFLSDEGRFARLRLSPEATLTLALPKRGMDVPDRKARFGKLFLGDIGIPPELYRTMGVYVPPLFTTGPLMRLY